MALERRVHIIMNYRTRAYTRKCLDSPRHSTYQNFKIWIVDVENIDDTFQQNNRRNQEVSCLNPGIPFATQA